MPADARPYGNNTKANAEAINIADISVLNILAACNGLNLEMIILIIEMPREQCIIPGFDYYNNNLKRFDAGGLYDRYHSGPAKGANDSDFTAHIFRFWRPK